MKKNILPLAFVAGLSLIATSSQAQSFKDLFSTDNLSKVVNAVTGNTKAVDLTGTWNYGGSAVEFKSENLLKKAGGIAAASVAEGKLNEQLDKVGIKPGQMSFTFNPDSTFVSKVGNRTMRGTYSYNAATKHVNLQYLKLLNMKAKVNYATNSIELLFNADKLLKLMAFIGSKSNNTAYKTISSLANSYDGMMLGFGLNK